MNENPQFFGNPLGSKLDLAQNLIVQQMTPKEIGKNIEMVRKKLAMIDVFPSLKSMALKHQEANKFGIPSSEHLEVCPDCDQKVVVQELGICDDTVSKDMSSGVTLFFYFIKVCVAYLLLRQVLTDGFNLITNFAGSDCGNPNIEGMDSCAVDLYTRASTANKYNMRQHLKTLDILNLVALLLSFVFFYFARKQMFKLEMQVNNEEQTQDDYSIYVKNIPRILENATDVGYQRELKRMFENIVREWIEQNDAVWRANGWASPLYQDYLEASKLPGNPAQHFDIVKGVDLCWNLTELAVVKYIKEDIKTKMEKVATQDYDVQARERQLANNLDAVQDAYLRLSKVYTSVRDRRFSFGLSHFVGKAFVRFEYQHFAEAVRERFADDDVYIAGNKLEVEYASHPKDVYWENLHITDSERTSKQINSFLITLGALVFAFFFILAANIFQEKIQPQTGKEVDVTPQEKILTYSVTILVSVFITLVNYLLGRVISILTTYQQHESKSNHQLSNVLKLLPAQFFNTAMIYYMVSFIIPSRMWDRNGIIMNVSGLVTTSAVINVVMNLVNTSWLMHQFNMCWKYGKETEFNIFQDRLNKEFELPQFDIAGRYTYYIMSVYVVSFFNYIVPIGVPVLIVVFLIQYFIDKYNLFKKSSVKNVYSFKLAKTCFKLLQTSVLVKAVGDLVFSLAFNEWRVTTLNIVIMAFAGAYIVVLWFLPYNLELKLMRRFSLYEQKSYSNAKQNMKFEQTYKNQNPATSLTSRSLAQRFSKIITPQDLIKKGFFDANRADKIDEIVYN